MRHGDGRAAQAGSLRVVITRQAVSLDSPEEREKRSVCKMELEEVSGQERDQHQTRRQLLIPSPLQIHQELLGNTR